jgi:peptidylprolyl isomerase domain and WD repeat-containing protein 1
VFNEKPTREEQTLATTSLPAAPGRLATSAVIHTDKGDIQLRLFPDVAPKAVENFVGHAKSGYYENVIFHRIIKKFVRWAFSQL